MSSYSLVLPQVRSVRGFWPHPLLPSGHLQTLAASLLPAPKITYAAKPLPVDLGDGDTVVLHDDRPAGWRESAPAVLLVHGLCGSHAAPYMVRMSHLLNRRGCRTFRLDMRGCGASRDLCQEASHAGRSGDLLVALKQIASLCPHSPLQLVGVSLGGNQVLKLLGELCHRTDAANPVTCADDLKVLKRIQRAAVVAPPVDLTRCTDNLERWSMQPYSRYFIRRLLRQVPPRTLKHPLGEAFGSIRFLEQCVSSTTGLPHRCADSKTPPTTTPKPPRTPGLPRFACRRWFCLRKMIR